MKIILHAGAQKTGSTSLQRWFYKNEEHLNEIGVTCPKRLIAENNVDPIHRMITRLSSEKDLQKQSKDFGSRIRQIFAETGYHNILLSHENAFGSPFSKNSTAFYPDFELRIRRLKKLQLEQELDVEVIFFVREFGPFLRSSYVQYIRQGGTQSLPTFVEHIDVETISWLRLANVLHDAFPRLQTHNQ